MPETSSSTSQLRARLGRAPSSKREVMTDPRLAKKRETDRESQRIVRERTRKYISHLETLVQTLQKSQKDERLQSMTQQCKELRNENEQLKGIVTGVSRMIRSIECPKSVENNPTMLTPAPSSVTNQERHSAPPTNDDFPPIHPPQTASLRQQSLSSSAEQHLAQTAAACDTSSTILTQASPIQTSDIFTSFLQTHPQRPEALLTPQATDASEGLLADGKDDAHLFAVTSNALSKAQSLTVLSIDPERDADIAIRAVACGWRVAEQCHTLDSAWQLLRQIDQNIFFCCGSVERLAILRLLRLKLQDTADSTQQQPISLLPPFMSPRPVQNFVKHSLLIDYIVWPELREFLILKSATDVPNHVAAVFASSIRFLWPFDLIDTWTRNQITGFYSFSSLFNERFQDIRCWAMSSTFFDLCPELIGYIQIYNPTPGVTLRGDSGNGANNMVEKQSKAYDGAFGCSGLENDLDCNDRLAEDRATTLPI